MTQLALWPSEAPPPGRVRRVTWAWTCPEHGQQKEASGPAQKAAFTREVVLRIGMITCSVRGCSRALWPGREDGL